MLKQAQFEEAEEIERQLTQLKNEKIDELIVPNTFYCQFEQEIAKVKMLEYPKFPFQD